MPQPLRQTEVGSPVALCAGCGKKILWVITADGTRVSLDQAPPTYLLRVDERQEGLPVADRSRSFVSHFSTCPNANDFSASRKKDEHAPTSA